MENLTMNLRDHLAIEILKALITKTEVAALYYSAERSALAGIAYDFSDAMIKKSGTTKGENHAL